MSAQSIWQDGERDLERLSKTNQLQCPLLRLPAELRMTIYEMVFSERHIFKIYPKRDNPLCYAEYAGPCGTIALHGTCRQIRHESHELMRSFIANATLDVRNCGVKQFFCEFPWDTMLVTSIIIPNLWVYAWGYEQGLDQPLNVSGRLGSLKHVRIISNDYFFALGGPVPFKVGTVVDYLTHNRYRDGTLRVLGSRN